MPKVETLLMVVPLIEMSLPATKVTSPVWPWKEETVPDKSAEMVGVWLAAFVMTDVVSGLNCINLGGAVMFPLKNVWCLQPPGSGLRRHFLRQPKVGLQ